MSFQEFVSAIGIREIKRVVVTCGNFTQSLGFVCCEMEDSEDEISFYGKDYGEFFKIGAEGANIEYDGNNIFTISYSDNSTISIVAEY